MRRHPARVSVVALGILIGILVVAAPAAVQGAENPRRGGVLLAAIGADAPSLLENAHYIPGLWWRRSVVHWAKVKNYVAPPSHYTNQKLQDVWLAED